MKLKDRKKPAIMKSGKEHFRQEKYGIRMHIYGIYKDANDNPICKTEKETQMYRTDF